jgi:hypothetical protein
VRGVILGSKGCVPTTKRQTCSGDATSTDRDRSAGGDADGIANEATVGELVLVHIRPLLRAEVALAESARRDFPRVQVGTDLITIPAS